MEQRKFGNTEMQVSVLGLGTAGIGFTGSDDRTVDSLIGIACDAGINVLDTAAMYQDAEATLGRVMQHRRENFLLFTKCGRHAPRLPFTGRVIRRLKRPWLNFLGQEPADWQPRTLAWNIDQSLQRLRTDRIDLMQLHTCSLEQLKRGSVIETLQRAREAGKIRYIGYSGDGAAALWAAECGQFDAIQISVNVADQEALSQVIPIAQRHGLGIIAKRPVANGAWRETRPYVDPCERVYRDRLQTLNYDFLHGPQPAAQALTFTLSKTGVHTAIVGTTSTDHLRRNIQVAESQRMHFNEFESLRNRWKAVASEDWVGQM